MHFEHFLVLSTLKEYGNYNLIDSSDKLNYQTATLVFFVFSLITVIKQYFLKPIQCWIPPEFSRTWEAYAENYCWIQPTYLVSHDGPFPGENERHDKFNYYQWVPLVLVMQMCLSVLPYFLWTSLTNISGVNFKYIMNAIKEKRNDMNYKSDEMDEIAGKLHKMICLRRQQQEKKQLNQNLNRPRTIVNGLYSCRLFICYMFLKLIFVIVAFVQILIMQKFIGNIGFGFGIDILINLIKGRDWKVTNLFPRLSGCDIVIRRSGQPIKYSFMCVLPVNMLNEKFYICLWFLMVLCAFCSCCSGLLWLLKVCTKTRPSRLVRRLLIGWRGQAVRSSNKYKESDDKAGTGSLVQLSQTNSKDNMIDIDEFTNKYLQIDGIFVIYMINRQFGEIITSAIIEKLYDEFNADRNIL